MGERAERTDDNSENNRRKGGDVATDTRNNKNPNTTHGGGDTRSGPRISRAGADPRRDSETNGIEEHCGNGTRE